MFGSVRMLMYNVLQLCEGRELMLSDFIYLLSFNKDNFLILYSSAAFTRLLLAAAPSNISVLQLLQQNLSLHSVAIKGHAKWKNQEAACKVNLLAWQRNHYMLQTGNCS